MSPDCGWGVTDCLTTLLTNRIIDCSISAAEAEFWPEEQKRYLKAANYGMSALSEARLMGADEQGRGAIVDGAVSNDGIQGSGRGVEGFGSGASAAATAAPMEAVETSAAAATKVTILNESFVRCGRKLRVLNAVREASVGLPLTAAQYDKLSSA